jgi:hypothetical protein
MEKRFKIIETPDYYLAVSDEEIKESDYLYFWNGQSGTIHKLKENQSSDNMYGSGLKIIAYRPKNDAPELDLPLLPKIVVEDDVEKFDKIITEESEYWYKATGSLTSVEIVKRAFSMGLKAATKVYSENDLREAIKMAWEADSIDGTVDLYIVLHYGDNNDLRTKWTEDEIIQSLKQSKTPKWFVASDNDLLGKAENSSIGNVRRENGLMVTTINGKTYLVGEYLNKEAEEYVKLSLLNRKPTKHFIAGHNSKATQTKVIQAQMDILKRTASERWTDILEELQQQLKELEK